MHFNENDACISGGLADAGPPEVMSGFACRRAGSACPRERCSAGLLAGALVAERNFKAGRFGPDYVILVGKRTANADVRQPRARTARVKLEAGGGALLKADCPRALSFWGKGEDAAMNAMNKRLMSGLIVGLACFFGVVAGAEEAKLTHEQLVEMGLKASEKDMAWWRDAKFGIFIHWGVGIEKRHAPWANRTDDVYWENLFKNLAEVDKFDAVEWIKVVKESGARYVIFMTRQNGAMHRRPAGNFCLWDTQTTDNKITHPKSPFKRDVCKEIAGAAHKADIKLFWYVCGGAGKNVEELLTNYGKVHGIWFDGVAPAKGLTYKDILQTMRKLQPGIITNGRLAGNVYGGDYDTPQHDLPFPGWYSRPVEVAVTLRDGCWYWDKANPPVKSLKRVIGLLMRCVGQGANLALNLAPAPDGAMERNEVTRIKEAGNWLKKYGESVYGTRPGPYSPAEWGVSTHKGNTVYIHMLQDLDEGKLALHSISRKIAGSKLLTGGEVTVEQTKDAVKIAVAKGSVKEIDTIIALELDGPATDAKVTAPAAASLSKGKKATAESVFFWPALGITREMNGPQNAVDGDFDTGWCSRPSTREEGKNPRWLEVDLGRPATVGRALVAASGALGARRKGIQAFAIQCKKGEKWVTCFDSKSIRGIARKRWTHTVEFKPVTAQFFRLGVLGRNTYIREFQLFAAKGAG